MSAFAKSTFNTATYATSRPTYPPRLFEHIFNYYVNGRSREDGLKDRRWDRAADVGCGTGQATSHLTGRFKNVVCVDPSAGMLQKARDHLVVNSRSDLQAPSTNFSFTQGSAEDLHAAIPEDGSVDLLIAAQACHWFDWTKVWPETRRVLRRGSGVAAYWVYGEIRLTNFPSLTPLITEFWQGPEPPSTSGDSNSGVPKSLGAYFQRPGRTILERLLVDVPSPSSVLGASDCGLRDFQRAYFTERDLADVKSFNDSLEKQSGGESLTAALDPGFVGGGDIVMRFWKDLREGARRELLESAKVDPTGGDNDSGTPNFTFLRIVSAVN
ncbi:hypothetical protein EST38_g7632 [Candolleomyces aberdarensis]|uniref:Methyltransferase type 11 domain-containing protein n=1 Tax=Candolleomyces aberdarensis TaxID=2316362 RepID=A0A4Q2DER0_9AGAR|nr:hypothetical protein EST38_g7632 [Candolleomyces aberdarensis]